MRLLGDDGIDDRSGREQSNRRGDGDGWRWRHGRELGGHGALGLMGRDLAFEVARELIDLAARVGQGQGEAELDLLGELAVIEQPRDLLAVGDLEQGDGLLGVVVVPQELGETPLPAAPAALEDDPAVGDRRRARVDRGGDLLPLDASALGGADVV